MDMDHACRYAERDQELDFGCEHMPLITPVEILGFSTCEGASAKTVFVEECGWVCKHGRPVSRCVYTVDPYGYYDLADTLEGCYVDSLCLCQDEALTQCDHEARFIQCYRTEEAVTRMEAQDKAEGHIAGIASSNASLTKKYGSLQQAYTEQQAELAELENDNEEVSEQLTTALTELEETRDAHRAAVARHSSASLEAEKNADTAIINEKRLDRVEDRLAAEIKKREKTEAELEASNRTNSRLFLALGVVMIAAVAATGAALYYKKKKPRVVLVGGTGSTGDNSEVTVQNTSVVMGRAVPTESAKEAQNVSLDDDNIRKGSGTSTVDIA
jgi:hypothetical protein